MVSTCHDPMWKRLATIIFTMALRTMKKMRPGNSRPPRSAGLSGGGPIFHLSCWNVNELCSKITKTFWLVVAILGSTGLSKTLNCAWHINFDVHKFEKLGIDLLLPGYHKGGMPLCCHKNPDGLVFWEGLLFFAPLRAASVACVLAKSPLKSSLTPFRTSLQTRHPIETNGSFNCHPTSLSRNFVGPIFGGFCVHTCLGRLGILGTTSSEMKMKIADDNNWWILKCVFNQDLATLNHIIWNWLWKYGEKHTAKGLLKNGTIVSIAHVVGIIGLWCLC